MPDSLAALPLSPSTGLRSADDAVVVDVADREVRDRHSWLSTMPADLIHLGPWRVAPGGGPEESAETESGLRDGYARPDHDDHQWASCARINEISIGAPSWESDSFRGWIWYRSRFTVPAQPVVDGRLVLGSPTECREVRWSVYLDGEELTEQPVPAGVLELDVPADRLTAGEHSLVVRQHVDSEVSVERRQELEGWRRIDVFCQQTLTLGADFERVQLDRVEVDGDTVTATDAAGSWRLESRYATGPDGVFKFSRLIRLGSPAVLSDLRLAEVAGPVSMLHPEGFWAGLDDGLVLAGVDPATVTIRTADGAAVHTWPGVRLATDEALELPPVFLAVDPDGDPRVPVARLLTRLGRPREDVAIYDPYGWYQISHASELKIEVSDELMGPIADVLAAARDQGLTFDFVSLDCGWNDPDDLSRFHPQSFPNGPQSVLDAVADNDTALMLWVSPSDGPRAFRHELGLVNPGFDGGTSLNPVLPWRLCPSFAPWRETFRAALLHLVEAYGVRGFKLDGTELYCRSADHDHLPGLWSVWANVRSLQATLSAVSEAGASYLMLYWGLRSPWWLRWASTVWERGYLVEAAAPSGRASWAIRGSVMSSQDIGTTADWWSLPAHQQDSLGVWVSDTAWAAHQGLPDWDDATVMDAARGSRALQLWGDLRPVVGPEADRLKSVIDLLRARRRELDGVGRPLGSAASGEQAYGYVWRSDQTAWIVLNQPGDGGESFFDWAALGAGPEAFPAAGIDYLSRQGAARVQVDVDGVRIWQSGGSVVGVAFGVAGVAETEIGLVGAAGSVSIVDDGLRAEPPADDQRAPALIGRVPHLANWMAGDVDGVAYDPSMLIGTPAEDRELGGREQSWRVDIRADRDAEVAVVVRFARDGTAWHHDLLHEVARLDVLVDGEPLPGTSYPTFRHEQAGSWSWLRWTTDVPAGDHTLDVTLQATCPTDLTTTLDVWLR